MLSTHTDSYDSGILHIHIATTSLLHQCLLQELDSWCEKLKSYPICSLSEPLKLVADWHTDSEGHEYTFSANGMQVYREFADEMVRVMNKQWETG